MNSASGLVAAPSVTEKFRPIPLVPPPSAVLPQYRGDAFRPVVVEDLGLCITGDPTCLHVVSIRSQLARFDVPAHVWIEGFAVNGLSLYVQDGPVLQCWALDAPLPRLRYPRFCRNLLTGTTWDGSGESPADLYMVPSANQPLADALQAARQSDAWATFVEEAEATLRGTIATIRSAPLRQFAAAVAVYKATGQALQQMRAMLGANDNSQPAPALTAGLHADRVAAEQNAAAIRFAAPVVRPNLLGTAPAVFTLSGAGRLYCCDDSLAQVEVVQVSAPAVPQLAMVETATGTCMLFYPAANGGVERVDASVSPPAAIAAIAGTPPIAPEEILPLATAGDYVWGGGLPAVALFGDPVTSVAATPAFVVASGTFTGYDVDASSKLVLAFDASSTLLTSYDPDAKEPNRWPGATEPVPVWISFWPDTRLNPVPAMPRLVLSFGRAVPAGQIGVGYCVYVANTVDDALNLGTFTPPTTLVAGTLDTSAFAGVTTPIAQLRAQPTVSDDVAYAIGRSLSPTDEVAALVRSVDPHTGLLAPSPWSTFFGANQAAFATSTGAWALGQCPLPPVDGRDALAAFDMSAVRAAVATAAPAELARIQQKVATAQSGVALQVQILNGTDPVTNQSLEFLTTYRPQPGDPTASVTITTDGNGYGSLSGVYVGSQLMLTNTIFYAMPSWSTLSATGVTLITIYSIDIGP